MVKEKNTKISKHEMDRWYAQVDEMVDKFEEMMEAEHIKEGQCQVQTWVMVTMMKNWSQR